MMRDTPTQPKRSVGRLQVGEPMHEDGVFSVDFLFTCTAKTIGEDEIKSASIQVAKEFGRMLKANGFWKRGQDFGKPDTIMRQLKPDVIHIICAVRTPPKNPIIITTQ